MSVSFNLHAVEHPSESIEIQNAIDLVQKDGMALERLDEWLRDNDEVVAVAVEQNGLALQFASERLRNKQSIVSYAVQNNGLALQFASEDRRNNQGPAYDAFRQNPEAKAFFGDQLRSNSRLLLALVTKEDCSILAIADPRLTNDDNFMGQMIETNGSAVKYAGRELILKLVQVEGRLLEHVNPAFQDDPEIVEAATNQNPDAFRYASRRLVLERVGIDGLTLEYASREFRDDVEIVSAAIGQNRDALQFALKNAILALVPRKNGKFTNREAVLALVKEDGLMLREASDELREDAVIVSSAVIQNWEALGYVNPQLRDNQMILSIAMEADPRALQLAGRGAVLALVQQNAALFRFASLEHRNDLEIARLATTGNPGLIQYTGRDAVLALVREDPWLIAHARPEQRDDWEIMREAVSVVGETFEYASLRLRDDFNLAEMAVLDLPVMIQYASRRVALRLLAEENGLLLKHAGWGYQGDEEAVLAAVSQNPKAIKYATGLLKRDKDLTHVLKALHPNNSGFVGA